MKNWGFCDLCVTAPDNTDNLKDILLRLQKAGYNTVVINQNVDEAVFENEKKKKKKTVEIDTFCPVPEPIDVSELKNLFKGKLNILSRITFSFSDPVKTHSMNQLTVLKKYNIYAVIPKTQAAFQFACSQLGADIILINSTSSGLKWSRKLYFQAVEKGIHFEIQYAPVIKNSTRKLAIHVSHLCYTFGKSKNIIISSGANDPSVIRNPYDVINLARMLGLDESKAKMAILQQAHHVLAKGGSLLLKVDVLEKLSLKFNAVRLIDLTARRKKGKNSKPKIRC
ncbi:ribonuclease P protein subunit p30 [Copidosoma floridanum]|uniref:ribonuclease P protein subunit p30 n=1 Tax=Copidosoma floridanum TaxID=29053 RepID=UPI0006C9A9C6|nr:ribonuclease P protein subunit p30 [Copidosoma floridanum]